MARRQAWTVLAAITFACHAPRPHPVRTTVLEDPHTVPDPPVLVIPAPQPAPDSAPSPLASPSPSQAPASVGGGGGGGGGYVPSESPSPAAEASPTPSPSPTAEASATPPPTPSPSPSPSATPTASPPPGGPTYQGFAALSGEAPDFLDVTQDLETVPTWLHSGQWFLMPSVAGFLGGVYRQDETGAYPHFSMRRFQGDTFGPNGLLPSHYKVSVAVQAFEMPTWQPPLGENGVLVYYQDPTHYVELVIGNGSVAVWEANGGAPTGSAGWKDYHYHGVGTAPGEIRRVAAQINTQSQTLTYWVEGVQAASVTVPLLGTSGWHGFALRSIGNPIHFGELLIEALP